ncbi:aminoglycoside phosphotransferase family protein [Sphingomonas sp. ID0503]|uniref:aminoglycoside phosphotransferase family protein n=1 Tax=Sphingomonas sp. ID0503 TaxID=3399691 RepID=UPI003AFAAE10
MIPPATAMPFLAANGWGDGTILPLAGDASFRRYFRVAAPGRTAVLMDAPPEHEDSRPFLAVAAHLRSTGFAAPQVFATDLDAGLILLEDFGDDRVAEAVALDPSREAKIYGDAVDLLLRLHSVPPPADLPPYDRAVYQREAGLFTEWYGPAVDLPVDVEAYVSAWNTVLAQVTERSVLVLRDYHAENIMLREGQDLALLDFQDALTGHPAYDLVSLLQDARRDVSAATEASMLARYRSSRPLDDAAYAILGAQRNAKILGIFTRLWKRDGKPRYLSLQPRVWRYLERDLAHPALAPVKAWFDRNVPVEKRAAAWTAGTLAT